ncbi:MULTISPECIES: acetolactate synthase small subunit [unclassified Agarivorans]|uniref:acetolactate synthase small subunit n=1 Tax=unclassified Agarivorans TaxID=2636026 RepID=UPI0010E5F479|nr:MULTISPECIES: acetolactate synthase small subunit [unclassified Agarivorans]MDO6686837.1 acetolactate synthase small subunit [Agarivorans sp. 3_MG-2023]MDO6716634.1 acetolactate synthase small subunit [Agarivorans sp. 2_MG-2023]MDO6764627.1 acetolactate synthase small subunit [Agarivorans sp. 1_MG-2023]GDY26465.1 acetolactate synthase small subunit [Agarivorans sp. Toyoura001]
MRRIISVLLENEAGALSRVTGLFSQRGFNIDSLTVSTTEDPTLSRMSICTYGDENTIEQITKQLNKLVDVLKVSELTEAEHVEREIMLVKVRAAGAIREEVMRTCDIFRGQIVDVTPSMYIMQLSGDSAKLDACVKTLAQSTEILEVVRSGVCGMSRGERMLRP